MRGASESACAWRVRRERRFTSSVRWEMWRKNWPTYCWTLALVPKQVFAVTSSRTQPQMASSGLKSGL